MQHSKLLLACGLILSVSLSSCTVRVAEKLLDEAKFQETEQNYASVAYGSAISPAQSDHVIIPVGYQLEKYKRLISRWA